MTEDNQRADFYMGRADYAQYLGTKERGHPTVVNVWSSFQNRSAEPYTGETFAVIAATLSDTRTWPHEHTSSVETPWAYCWDKGTTYVYHYGVEVAQIRSTTHSWQYKLVTLDDGREVIEPAEREFRPKNPVAFPRVRRASAT